MFRGFLPVGGWLKLADGNRILISQRTSVSRSVVDVVGYDKYYNFQVVSGFCIKLDRKISFRYSKTLTTSPTR